MAWFARRMKVRMSPFYHRPLLRRPRLAHRACDQTVLVEPAFERAVEERRAPTRLEADQFGQSRVAAEQERGPPREALLERVAKLRVKIRQRTGAGESNAVGRIGD